MSGSRAGFVGELAWGGVAWGGVAAVEVGPALAELAAMFDNLVSEIWAEMARIPPMKSTSPPSTANAGAWLRKKNNTRGREISRATRTIVEGKTIARTAWVVRLLAAITSRKSAAWFVSESDS